MRRLLCFGAGISPSFDAEAHTGSHGICSCFSVSVRQQFQLHKAKNLKAAKQENIQKMRTVALDKLMEVAFEKIGHFFPPFANAPASRD